MVREVRGRTETSSGSAQELSGLAEQLSAALEEIAGNTAAITASASGTQGDAVSMAEECAAITAYSGEMRGRAEQMERSARQEMEEVRLNDVRGVALILLPGLDGALQLRQDGLPQVVRQLLSAVGEIVHRAGNLVADLLDMVGGLRQSGDRRRTAASGGHLRQSVVRLFPGKYILPLPKDMRKARAGRNTPARS